MIYPNIYMVMQTLCTLFSTTFHKIERNIVQLTKILSGLRSLCAIGGLRLWRYDKPLAICFEKRQTRPLGSPLVSGVFCFSIYLYRLSFIYSITIKSCPAFRCISDMSLSNVPVPLNATMLSCRKSL